MKKFKNDALRNGVKQLKMRLLDDKGKEMGYYYGYYTTPEDIQEVTDEIIGPNQRYWCVGDHG